MYKRQLFSQANLVSAIRLPNNLFTDNAGTEVGRDLIVLQKNLSTVSYTHLGGESFELDARLSFKKDGEGNILSLVHI